MAGEKDSLPEFMNFKLFSKTILLVNIKFGLLLGHPPASEKKASGHLAEAGVGRSASAIVLPISASLQRTPSAGRRQHAST